MVNGTASLHLAGDPDPRLLKRVNGTVSMSRRGRLELDIQANPVSRSVPPSQRPVTMRSETAPRNLRAEQTAAEKKSLAREIARGNDECGIESSASAIAVPSIGDGSRRRRPPRDDASGHVVARRPLPPRRIDPLVRAHHER